MLDLDHAGPPGGPTDTMSLRQVYGRFPTGVVAICALHGGDPVGLAVSSFNTVSVEPPLVGVCIRCNSRSLPLLAASPAVGLSVLAEHQEGLSRQLARWSIPERFRNVAWSVTGNGAVLISGAAAWLECGFDDIRTVGDHDLAILRVRRHRVDDTQDPLVFHASAFHRLTATDRAGGVGSEAP